MKISEIREQTPGIVDGRIHLNGSSSLASQPVLDRVKGQIEMEAHSHSDPESHGRANQAISDSQEHVATFLNCSSNEVLMAMVDKQHILDCIFRALQTPCRTRVLTHGVSFTSFSKRYDVEKIASNGDGSADLSNLYSIADETVAAIVVQHVAEGASTASNISAICQTAREIQALVVVDASNSIGLMNVDFADMQVDMLVAKGNGYLRGPHNTTLAVIKQSEHTASIREALLHDSQARVCAAGEGATSGDVCGTHAFLVGLGAACMYARQLGLSDVAQRIAWLARVFLDGVADIPFVVVEGCPTTEWRRPEARVGFIALSHARRELTPQLFTLLKHDNIVTGMTESDPKGSPPKLVVTLQYYNTKDEVLLTLGALERHAKALEMDAEAAEDSEWVALELSDAAFHDGASAIHCGAAAMDEKEQTSSDVVKAICEASGQCHEDAQSMSSVAPPINVAPSAPHTTYPDPSRDARALPDARCQDMVEDHTQGTAETGGEDDAVLFVTSGVSRACVATPAAGVQPLAVPVSESSEVSADDEGDGSGSDTCDDDATTTGRQHLPSLSSGRVSAGVLCAPGRSAAWEHLTTSLSCDDATTASEDDEPWVQTGFQDAVPPRVITFTNPLFGVELPHSDSDAVDTDFEDQFDADAVCTYYGSSTVTDDDMDATSDDDDEDDNTASGPCDVAAHASTAPITSKACTVRSAAPSAGSYTPPRTQPVAIPYPTHAHRRGLFDALDPTISSHRAAAPSGMTAFYVGSSPDNYYERMTKGLCQERYHTAPNYHATAYETDSAASDSSEITMDDLRSSTPPPGASARGVGLGSWCNLLNKRVGSDSSLDSGLDLGYGGAIPIAGLFGSL
eukprot:m.206958 g.206958  ORF g.206958 m.206958 type:complete len:855 (-) comp18911_c0_seq2:298-2862(-)